MATLTGRFGESYQWITVTIGTEVSGTAYFPSNGVGGTTATYAGSLVDGALTTALVRIVGNNLVSGDTVAVVDSSGNTVGGLLHTIKSTTQVFDYGPQGVNVNGPIGLKVTGTGTYTMLFKVLA